MNFSRNIFGSLCLFLYGQPIVDHLFLPFKVYIFNQIKHPSILALQTKINFEIKDDYFSVCLFTQALQMLAAQLPMLKMTTLMTFSKTMLSTAATLVNAVAIILKTTIVAKAKTAGAVFTTAAMTASTIVITST
jgi:hypothetical protein